MIALGGGAAGAYAAVHKRLSAAFVGVAIATALVPPLATAGMFLARGQFSLSGGAFLLVFANIVGIQFACSMVFLLTGFRKSARRTKLDSLSVGVLLVLGALLTVNLHSVVGKQLYESAVRTTIKRDLLSFPGAYLADLRFSPAGDRTIVRATVRGPEPFSATQVASMESGLPTTPEHNISALLIRYVHTTVTSETGPIYSTEETAADKDNR